MIVDGLKSSTSKRRYRKDSASSSSSTPSHHSRCVGRSSPLPFPELITGSTSRTPGHTCWLSSPTSRAPCSVKPSLTAGVGSKSSSLTLSRRWTSTSSGSRSATSLLRHRAS
jgi:hypothetical protein